MSRFIITGGKKLAGTIRVAGNKNSALKLMAAALLADGVTTLTNVPRIRDVDAMCDLLEDVGAKVDGKGTSELRIDATSLKSHTPSREIIERFRASVLIASPLLARFGKAVIYAPGGDQIGERLLDTHFSMMEKLGVEVKKDGGRFELIWKTRKGGNVFLEEASVTATEMAIILASTLEEEVVIEGAAAEPHVNDLVSFVEKMGASVTGVGTHRLTVKGKAKLVPVEHRVIPDHIEGGTFAIAGAITGGELVVEDTPEDHYRMMLNYLKDMGVDATLDSERLIVKPSKLIAKRRKFQTRPWPGFPTDLMSPFIVLATQTEGTVLCHDWMYEWRMFFVDDLINMGANIFIADPHRVIVSGPTKLKGDVLFSKDIRAGMSIILAALAAEGESEIRNVEMVERGYEVLDERLKNIGADIKRLPGTDDKKP